MSLDRAGSFLYSLDEANALRNGPQGALSKTLF